MPEESEVRAFYSGKNFFITGGTGFVGLCLIEKLLRSVPDVGKIYLLMRPKKGKEISQRLEEFPKNLIFEKLIEAKGTDIFNKLVPVSGDVGQDNLGLSPTDRQMLINNINVVIHSAATLDFQENLRPTVNINLLGTRRIMELCKEIKNLKVMVHVSSGYVNSYLKEAHEKVYEAPEDPEKVISLIGIMTDDTLEDMEPAVLKTHPNTYTFTKHLAEHEVANCADSFPCTIVRPTMIVGAWKEPIPGWTCSKVGPQGFLMGASKGVVRRLPLALDNIADYIPVDVVVNQLLVAGWNAAKSKPFRWSAIQHTVNETMHKYPLKSAVWYPHLKFMPSLWLFKLSAIFVHFFQAILLDMLLRITGGRPILISGHVRSSQTFVVASDINKNLQYPCEQFGRFVDFQWSEKIDCLYLHKIYHTRIHKMYGPIAVRWSNFTNLHLGVRRYLNNEKETTLPAARKKDTMLLCMHQLWQAMIISLCWYLVACMLGSTIIQSAWVAPAIYILYCCL
ncbi:hypothetical protein ACJJTC_019102 [Scirpophaga incertulas]